MGDGLPDSGAAGVISWDNSIGQSEMSLYQSAQDSFGQRSTTSSVFASAREFQIDKSIARSKMQSTPLAEEDEQDAEKSDADSFFSTSDNENQDAPFANDECMTHVGLQPPDYSQAGPPEAQMSVAHVGSGSTRGLGYDTQEVLCKSSCSGKAFGGCSGAHSAREGHDEAAAQRQREEEEWEAAKRAMDEQDAEERNHAKKLAAQQARVVVETVEAKETEAGVEAVKKEEEADQGAKVVCDTVSTAPATNQSPSTESGGFPVRMEAMALEAMSKKELVLLVQVLASPQLLQAAQLSGNPHNVAKKASKEKIVQVYNKIYDEAPEDIANTLQHTEPRCALKDCMPSEQAVVDSMPDCMPSEQAVVDRAVMETIETKADTEKEAAEEEQKAAGETNVEEEEKRLQKKGPAILEREMADMKVGGGGGRATKTKEALEQLAREEQGDVHSKNVLHVAAAESAAAAAATCLEEGDIDGARTFRAKAADEWTAACVGEENVKMRVEALDQLIESTLANLKQQYEDAAAAVAAEAEEAVTAAAAQKEEQAKKTKEEEDARQKAEAEERAAAKKAKEEEDARQKEEAEERATEERERERQQQEREEKEGRRRKEEEDMLRKEEEIQREATKKEEQARKAKEEEDVRKHAEAEAAATAVAAAAAKEEAARRAREEEEARLKAEEGEKARHQQEREEEERRRREEEDKLRQEEEIRKERAAEAEKEEQARKEERARAEAEEEAARLLKEEEEFFRREEEERLRLEEEEAAAVAQQKAVLAVRRAHWMAADKAMAVTRERLAELDLDGAKAARATAAYEWECAGEDALLWLQPLDQEIRVSAAVLEGNVAKAAEVDETARQRSLAISSGSVPFSLSISERNDSGAPTSSDSEDHDEAASPMMSAGMSALEKSCIGEDMFSSCLDKTTRIHDTPSTTSQYAKTNTMPWLEGPMVSVEHLGGASAAVAAPLPQNALRHTQLQVPLSLHEVSQDTQASVSSMSTDQNNIDNDPLPPFCTGSGEDTSPRAEVMPRASMPEVCMSSHGGLTPLHRACQQGNFEAAKSLIAAGSDPSIRDDYWYCPLHYAAKGGHTQLIDLIVCDGLAEAESETRDGLTALHLAVAHGHYNTVAALLRHMSQDALNHQDQEGRTALHYGCDADSKVGIVEILVKAGGDVHRTDFTALTPIHLARHSGARAVLAALERERRTSPDSAPLSPSAPRVGNSAIFTHPQVHADDSLRAVGAPPAGWSPPVRPAAGLAQLLPASPGVREHGQSLLHRASPVAAIDGALVGARGAIGSGGCSPASSWGSKSYVEQDIVTGRGEVWVARPLEAGVPTADNDWGMRTVEIDPNSSAAPTRFPTAVMANMIPISETAPMVMENNRTHAHTYGRMHGRAAGVMPPQQAVQGGPADFSRAQQGGPADFSKWEEDTAGSLATIKHHGAPARAPGASVMDLTRSVTDDWIVVDSDDDDPVQYHRAVPGPVTQGSGGEGDGWQETVNQAKNAALQVKMGIANLWNSLGK